MTVGDITLWIAKARQGDSGALGKVFAALYPELRGIAHRRLARDVRQPMLDTTALVHECYLKFCSAQQLSVEDRVHFLSYCATAMRSIIVDAARSAKADRHGGGAAHVALDTSHGESLAPPEEEILDVDAALSALAELDPRLVRVVEMRYFAGMTDLEIGQVLGLTDRTVRRDWDKARLLLAHALRG